MAKIKHTGGAGPKKVQMKSAPAPRAPRPQDAPDLTDDAQPDPLPENPAPRTAEPPRSPLLDAGGVMGTKPLPLAGAAPLIEDAQVVSETPHGAPDAPPAPAPAPPPGIPPPPPVAREFRPFTRPASAAPAGDDLLSDFPPDEPVEAPSGDAELSAAATERMAASTADTLLLMFGHVSNLVAEGYTEIDERPFISQVNAGQMPPEVVGEVRELNAENGRVKAFTKGHRDMLRGPLINYCRAAGITDLPPGIMLVLVLTLVLVLMGIDTRKRLRRHDELVDAMMRRYAPQADVVGSAPLSSSASAARP